MNTTSTPEERARDAQIAAAVDAFRDLIERGERPDLAEYAARYPAVADDLRDILPALRLLAPESPPSTASAGSVLGDFHIRREVGRGGMGIVYEAEQISLGRRVALKVLPFAGTLDPRHLQRFQNEARAAASLHHPNIVPVYAVGSASGVHFYAMQFIDGTPLDKVIARPAVVAESQTTTPERASAATGAEPEPARPAASVPRDPAYFRQVAEWGIQAAEALDYAHGLGIIHRDIKPGNLIVDGQGTLWVADFGLARTAVDTGLTMTGDVVGTLRYMSPEQAQARHGLVDHRTDVYALGATLYELVTGRPAVAGNSRPEILQNLANTDPPSPRKLVPGVPTDLETILLKALGKEPGERYATAGELALDLKRWLTDEPIQARPPSLWDRARKWAGRHRELVGTALLALAVLAAVLAAGTVLLWQENHATTRALGQAKYQEGEALRQEAEAKQNALKEAAARKLAEENWMRALGMLEIHRKWAGQVYKSGEWQEAVALYREEIRLLEEALNTLPRDVTLSPGHAEQLVKVAYDCAEVLTEAAATEEAAQAWLYAARVFRRQVEGRGISWQNRLGELVLANTSAGELLVACGRPAQAEEILRATPPVVRQFFDAIGEIEEARKADYEMFLLPVEAHLGMALADQGKPDEAERLFKQAIERVAPVPRAGPFSAQFDYELARLLQRRGDVLLRLGRLAEAGTCYREARDVLEDFLKAHGNLRAAVRSRLELAWLLAMCPDPACRNPRRALELARDIKTVSVRSQKVLAAALYRTGDARGALAALQDAAKKRPARGAEPAERFLYVLAHAALGERDRAMRWYPSAETAVRQIHPHCEVLKRLHAEAEAALNALPK